MFCILLTCFETTVINVGPICESLFIVDPAGNLGSVKVEGATGEPVKEEKPEASDVDMVSEPEVTPVGQEYIEEITNDEGQLTIFCTVILKLIELF